MNILATIGNTVIKNSHRILFATTVAGAIVTPVIAVKNTFDSAHDIQNEELELKKNLDTKEKVKLVWKNYIPTAGMMAFTVISAVGMHTSNQKRYAAIVGLYSASREFYSQYQEKVKEEIGEEKERDIREELKNLKETPSGKFRVYEPFSNQYFWTTTEQLMWAELTVNKMFQQDDWVSLNDFLELLPGAKQRKEGDKIGWDRYTDSSAWDWSFYGTPWIDVKPQIADDDEGEPIMVLRFGMPPKEPIFDEDNDPIKVVFTELKKEEGA